MFWIHDLSLPAQLRPPGLIDGLAGIEDEYSVFRGLDIFEASVAAEIATVAPVLQQVVVMRR